MTVLYKQKSLICVNVCFSPATVHESEHEKASSVVAAATMRRLSLICWQSQDSVKLTDDKVLTQLTPIATFSSSFDVKVSRIHLQLKYFFLV